MALGNCYALLARVAAALVLVQLTACNTSTMYPRTLDASSVPQRGEAIILVGNAGPATIDYLQFTHSSIPAINARNLALRPGGIVAIPVPVGTSHLELTTYTTVGNPGGYLPNGMSMGYVPIRTPPMDITTPGLYYVATVFPTRRASANYDSKPDAGALLRFKASQPNIAKSLSPINFRWPG